jgi:predicted PurR-regulated permease PerM
VAPEPIIIVAAATTLMWAVFYAACLAVLLRGLHRKSHGLVKRAAGFLLSLGILLGFFSAFGNKVLPPDFQARQLMNLPAEAKVFRIEHGEWPGDGTIHFRLPSSRSPEESMETVWTRNVPKPEPSVIQNMTHFKEHYEYVYVYSIMRRILRYDPRTQVYTYIVETNR